MADRPILFSSPMVLALLAGRKTQTRRILKPQPFIDQQGNLCCQDASGKVWNYGQKWDGTPNFRNFADCDVRIKAGDRLWVRETVTAYEQDDGLDGVLYRADGAFRPIKASAEAADRWCALHAYRGQRGATVPPIHAPRWTSRITLDVTEVRVERLQSISRGDAMEEGCPFPNMAKGPNPVDWYADLWNDINGPGAWEANPFVAAYTFRVTLANIDHIGVAA